MANFDLEGLLSNPAFQMGLGILGNNNTENTAQVIGRGGLMGLNNYQQQQQFKQLNDVRQSQVDVTKRQQDFIEQQQAQKEAAIQRAIEKNPELADIFAINPDAALKMAFPQANQVDPFTDKITDENGNVYLWNRRETDPQKAITPFMVDGKPFVEARYSAPLLGGIEFSKQINKGRATPTDMEDGVIQTEADLVNKISNVPQNIPRLPQGQPQANPLQIPPQIQQGRDGGRAQVLQYELQQAQQALQDPRAQDPAVKEDIMRSIEGITAELSNMQTQQPAQLPQVSPTAGLPKIGQPVAGGGIRVPTKAEAAAMVETAKAEADFNSPEATKKREMANEFKKTTAQNVINAIDSVMERVDGWSAGVGGNLMRKAPFNNDAKDIVADLETVKANFGFDRLQTMRDMSPTGGALGQVAVQELTALQASVANLSAENQSPEQLKRNLEKAKTHYKNWLDTLEGKTPSNNEESSNSGWSIKRK